MFDFTADALFRDAAVFAACFAITTGLYTLVLLYLRRRDGAEATPFVWYARDYFRDNKRLYGFLGLVLFLSVFACRLVLPKLVLAVCYSLAILRLFTPKD